MRKVGCSASAGLRCPGLTASRCRSRVQRAFCDILATIAAFTLPCALWTAAAALPLQGSVQAVGSDASAEPAAAGCGEPGISLRAEAGGLTRISVGSSCRAGELVSITYADATLVERLKPRKAALTADARRFESSEELSDSVARDANGIGFVGFAYLRNAKALEIANDCGIAYAPSVFNVKTEQYPLSRRLFLYGTNVPPGSVAARLVEFVASPAAQDVVRAEGFVDQSIELLDDRDQVMRLADGLIGLESDVDPAVLRELALGLKHSARMSTTLVFRLSSAKLDSKAEADVGRIADFIRDLRKSDPAKSVVLAGFTDSVGDFLTNRSLSQARAEQIQADLLQALGPDVPASAVVARGYSKLLPTSCNTTKEGRNRNRRVEVWVK